MVKLETYWRSNREWFHFDAQGCVLNDDHPERISRLILAVTLSRPNETVKRVIGGWITMAQADDYKGIRIDIAEHSYTEAWLRKTRKLYQLMGTVGKTKSFDRFIIQAESCLTHDAYEMLPRIICPTLVIGGTNDRIVTGEASREIADQISGSRLKMYPGIGHGLHETPDFLEQVKQYC